MTNIIINGDSVNYFLYLLEFLAAWKNRPEYLTRMACQWCFALSDCRAFGGHRQSTIILYHLRHTARHQEHHRSEAPTPGYHVTHSALIERDFSKTTLDYPSANTDAARSQAQHFTPDIYSCLLSITLEVGFRLAGTESEWECIPLDRTPHHERMLETAFRSDDDEVIADAVCMWIMNGVRTPLDSFARHFAKRIQRGVPFSPRLQRLSMRAIKCIWDSGFKMSGPKTVYLLNHLGVGGVDVDGAAKGNWALLLGDVIRGPAGLDLLPDYWRLLDQLVVGKVCPWPLGSRDTKVMIFLRAAGEWEKLETWALIFWTCLPRSMAGPRSMEYIKRVTLKLLSQRPSALPRFKGICEKGPLSHDQWHVENLKAVCEHVENLKGVCERVRANQFASKGPPVQPYVCPSRRLVTRSNFRFFLQSTRPHKATPSPSSCSGRQLLILLLFHEHGTIPMLQPNFLFRSTYTGQLRATNIGGDTR